MVQNSLIGQPGNPPGRNRGGPWSGS